MFRSFFVLPFCEVFRNVQVRAQRAIFQEFGPERITTLFRETGADEWQDPASIERLLKSVDSRTFRLWSAIGRMTEGLVMDEDGTPRVGGEFGSIDARPTC